MKRAALLAVLCTHSVDPKAVTVEWTAFKTTEKLAVQGTFKDVRVTVPKGGASSVARLLDRSSVHIDVTTPSTGDPARDATLKSAFFGLWSSHMARARIQDSVFDEKKGAGSLTLAITANGITKEIPLRIRSLPASAAPLKRFTAEGKIRIGDLGLTKPFQALHTACEALHKGPDGVSKTWDTVDIAFSFPLISRCEEPKRP